MAFPEVLIGAAPALAGFLVAGAGYVLALKLRPARGAKPVVEPAAEPVQENATQRGRVWTKYGHHRKAGGGEIHVVQPKGGGSRSTAVAGVVRAERIHKAAQSGMIKESLRIKG